MQRDFDPAHSQYYQPDQGMSHSFGYVYRRIMTEQDLSDHSGEHQHLLPAEPGHAAARLSLGKAIREAVESWPEDLRVVVMATGGLSHFVVDEEFDRSFLDLMAKGGVRGPRGAAAGKAAVGQFRAALLVGARRRGRRQGDDLIDYVPCYRSPAGTGCAMAFASWN